MALAAKAKDDSDAVKRLIAERDALAAEMTGDGAEAQQQRDGIEGQLLELGRQCQAARSARRRAEDSGGNRCGGAAACHGCA